MEAGQKSMAASGRGVSSRGVAEVGRGDNAGLKEAGNRGWSWRCSPVPISAPQQVPPPPPPGLTMDATETGSGVGTGGHLSTAP